LEQNVNPVHRASVRQAMVATMASTVPVNACVNWGLRAKHATAVLIRSQEIRATNVNEDGRTRTAIAVILAMVEQTAIPA